ncbi:MAG: DUF1830 domain-containing protein [Cyanobium sp.]
MGTCLYRNSSSQMVILRCIGPQAFFHEKVIFPFENWLFECPIDSRVDIWTHGLAGAEQVESLEAEDLMLAPEDSPSLSPR